MGHHYYHTDHQAQIVADKKQSQVQSSGKGGSAALLEAMLKEIAKKHYDKAISLSGRQGGQDMEIVNARGVCLMRTGRYDEAVALFRNLVLQPGCTWMRKERPVHFKTNFATALLLIGHPSGCLDMLHELGGEAPATTEALRAAVKKWESGLSWLSWLDWKINRIDPKNCTVPISFEPGEFAGDSAFVEAGAGEGTTTPPRNAA